MAKSFTFTIFLLCCFIIQASYAASPETQGKASDAKQAKNLEAEGENKDGSEDEHDENDSPIPFLTCSLFEGNSACTVTCFLFGSIYGQPITSGVCGEHNKCECQISPNASLEDYWNKKFDSEEVLRDILKNKKLSEKIFAILKTPFRTPQETKSDLRPHLTSKQLSSIQVKDKEVEKLLNADGGFNHVAVKEYVSKKSTYADLLKDKLITELSNSKRNVFDHIYDEVRLSQNKLLNKILNKYMKNNNISRSTTDAKGEQENLIDLLDAAVIDELIRPPSRDASSTSNKSVSQATEDNSDWWKLEGFKRNEVEELQQGHKCWDNMDYAVCVTKNGSETKLSWNNKNHNVIVKTLMHSGITSQKWYFPKATIYLYRANDGTVSQKWQFQNTIYRYGRDEDGDVSEDLWTNGEAPDSIEEYKRNIRLWCKENYYFTGESNCIIY